MKSQNTFLGKIGDKVTSIQQIFLYSTLSFYHKIEDLLN